MVTTHSCYSPHILGFLGYLTLTLGLPHTQVIHCYFRVLRVPHRNFRDPHCGIIYSHKLCFFWGGMAYLNLFQNMVFLQRIQISNPYSDQDRFLDLRIWTFPEYPYMVVRLHNWDFPWIFSHAILWLQDLDFSRIFAHGASRLGL